MPPDTSDLLSGYEEIAAFLRLKTPRRAKKLAERKAIPTFKLPGSDIVRARRSTLNAWLAECETRAQEAGVRSPPVCDVS